MEDLINPEWSDLNINYSIFKDEIICCVAGIVFVENESKHFDIRNKIKKLEEVINNSIIQIKNVSYENKESLIENMNEKKAMLENLLNKYEELEKNFTETDQYYRENLFKFYSNKYDHTSIFSFSERKLLLSVMNEIQILLKKKFDDFLYDYFNLRNAFFDINNYIIKVKKLFQNED